ncbi:MAG: hypothetical protein H6636_03835 [Anaerolineales bacterium]|nr:hypothetical protein [Anaerolineales bacterium]
MQDPQLMNLFKFDEADLALNRRGQLSEKQRARLAKEEAGRKGCASISGAGLLVVGLIGIPIAIVYYQAMHTLSMGGTLMFSGAFGCIWPLIWGGIGIVTLRRAFVQLKVAVQKVEGPINIVKSIRESYDSDSHTTSTYTVYQMFVAGRVFEVPASLGGYMMQGDEYAVYFADFQKVQAPEILSVEFLRAGRGGFVPSAIQDDLEVVAFLKNGETLQAIRAYRAIHQTSFEEARGRIEEMKMRLGY